MIAVDTNVLLRYLLRDDAEQAHLASRLITGTERVLVTDIVLVETIWTLQGKKYRLQKPDLVSVIQALFAEPNIRFENSEIVWLALNTYQEAKRVARKDADFADALIITKARYVIGEQGESFNGVYTFDKAAQDLPGASAQ
ncbi:MAG: type II toxin-antitoxin system VapC family toxin [Candidatus Competibacteraceae bacterium]|nr:type II toxin-antitoxin system VapC family toxin [Candidatus Competibacteraceae bacterium]